MHDQGEVGKSDNEQQTEPIGEVKTTTNGVLIFDRKGEVMYQYQIQ